MLRVFRTDDNLIALECLRRRKAFAMRWQTARLLAAVLDNATRSVGSRAVDDIVVHCSGSVVVLMHRSGQAIDFPIHDTIDGRPFCVSDSVAAALRSKAAEADELQHAEQIIADNGLMAWMGLPCGLSDHPQIKRESLKEAEKYCNREVRPPLGIEPRSIVGTPTITAHPSGAHP